MKHGLLIRNSYWHSASMDEMEALLAHAAKRLGIAFSVCGNGDIPIDLSVPPQLPCKADFVLFWDKDVRLARYLENGGYPLFNCADAIENCDDKTRTHLCLKALPSPRTVLAPLTFPGNGYPDISFLLRAEEALAYPMVIKEGNGSFGEQVYLAKDRAEALDLLTRLSGRPMLMQRYIRESHGQDKRLYMVNGRCVAAMRRVNDTDFRANIAIGGHALPYTPTREEELLAARALDMLHLTFAGVDILDSPQGPLLCEVNSNAHFTALHRLTGVDIAAHILEGILEKL